MTFVSIALAALLAAGAQNSTDLDANVATTRPVASPTPEAGGSAAKSTGPTKYCVLGTTTGTRMERKTCLTRAEWLDRGFDPLAPED